MATQGHNTTPLDELVVAAPLSHRLAAGLFWLGLTRRITWQEAAFALDAVEHFDEQTARQWRIAYTMLGGKDET